jgi:transposase
MEPVLRSFRKRLAFIADWFGKLLAILTPEARKVGSQRMCPFCGLITSRYKTLCLECGKALKPA